MTRLHKGHVGLAAALMLAQGGVGWMGSAVAAEGQITKIGGNRTTPCFLTEDYLRKTKVEDRPKPTSIGGEGFTISRGMQGIASDVFGRSLYLASGGLILDHAEVIAGDVSPQARLGDGPGRTASFPRMAGLTSHPFGTSLWVMENALPQDDPPTGRVRKVDLTTSDRTVTKIADTGPHPTGIAADGKGNVYVTEMQPSSAYVISPGGARTSLPTPISAPTSIAVDVTGTEIYVGGTDSVYRLTAGSWQVIAGPSIAHTDGGSSTMAPVGLAIGHETDGQSLSTRYLYIADDHGRLIRVDLKSSPTVITTVAGGGSALDSKTAIDANTVALKPDAIAADIAGHVYVADGDNCNIWQLQTPSPFRLTTAVTQPPGGPTNTTTPPNNGQTRDNNDTVAGTVGNNQANNGAVTQQGNGETQIVPGTQTNVQPQPQTELRIVDQGNVVTTPEQVAQPTVDALPTPAPTAQFTPTPAGTPTPSPDAGTVTLAEPGTSTAGVAADSAPGVPTAPAPAPVPPPPAPASAPPPAAQQPVSNVGLAHGDSAAPARGATRYAMVRNDDEAPMAALAVAGAGGLLAVLLCVLIVAPGASSKPAPRPRRAY